MSALNREEREYVRLTRCNLRSAGIRDTSKQDKAIRRGLAVMRKAKRRKLKLSGRELPIPEQHPYVLSVRRELGKLGLPKAQPDRKIRAGLARIVAATRAA